MTSKIAICMSFGGPVTATSVSVTGGVTVSSMTTSTATITNLLNVSMGSTIQISGRVVQIGISSTTTQTCVSTTTFTAVPTINKTITPLNATDYIHICLSGSLGKFASNSSYITIYRDNVNLGDNSFGLSSAETDSAVSAEVLNPVGITWIDRPGDISAHTYQAYIRSTSGTSSACFPENSTGTAYLLLEEISQ